MYEFASAKASLVLMFYLYTNGSSTKYRLVRGLKVSKVAIDRALEILTELQLCEIRESDSFPFSKTIRLTKTGLEFMASPVRELPALFWQMGNEEV